MAKNLGKKLWSVIETVQADSYISDAVKEKEYNKEKLRKIINASVINHRLSILNLQQFKKKYLNGPK